MSDESTASPWCSVHDEPAAECWSAECLYPTPVPHDLPPAETTAGEREVKALAADVWNDFEGSPFIDITCRDAESIARSVLASRSIAALLDRVRREEGARIAQAIEALPGPEGDQQEAYMLAASPAGARRRQEADWGRRVTTLPRMAKPKMVMRSLRVPEKLWEAVKAKADEREENISDVIREALERYVRRP